MTADHRDPEGPDELEERRLAREHRARLTGEALQRLRDRVPARHRAAGHLHPGVAGWVARLSEPEPPNLALVGPVGTGKSWQVWHAALLAVEHGLLGRVDVVGAEDFAARTAPADGNGHHQSRAAMASARLLVLDDVGVNRSSAWFVESLYAVVNPRYDALLPTVVTSNLADLASVLGDRVASRLAHNLVTVVLDGPDRRRA